MLDWDFTPAEALQAWPEQHGLAALVTGAPHPQWGVQTVLAEPAETHVVPWPAGSASAADGASVAGGASLAGQAVREQLRSILSTHAPADGGMWLALFCYELGALCEPTSMPQHRPPPDGWPLAVLCWCPAPLTYHHQRGQWSAPHAAAALPAHQLLCQLVRERVRGRAAAEPAAVTGLEADQPRAAFEQWVRRTVEYVRAGDIFQANIAQRFSARWQGSPRAVARAAFAASAPRFGAYLETPTHAAASMSPELFLRVNSAGNVVTRPIKGTRALHQDPAGLMASSKDAAELHMIVDLMRNDIGRVCAPGTVRVTDARSIESHATVHHCVAEVCGTLRPGADFLDLLWATFPPGSVTGAPKVRAMQVIDELEPVARGPYCGAVGALSADGYTLNVGIRTISMHRDAPGASAGTLRYSAGCGIVAESDPTDEYEESLHKTAVLLHTVHGLRATSAAGGLPARE